MTITKAEMKTEAIRRIKNLSKRYGLNPKILKAFKSGKLYYSYLTNRGSACCIEFISNDTRYQEIVRNFEEETGSMVYHAVRAITEEHGEMLSLLYVGNDQDEWEMEDLYQNYIATYTVNLTHPEHSEYGDVILSSYEWCSALLRYELFEEQIAHQRLESC